MIEVACPHCGTQLAFDLQTAGRQTKCIACQQKFRVPAQSHPKINPAFSIAFWLIILLIPSALTYFLWRSIGWWIFCIALTVLGILVESRTARHGLLATLRRLQQISVSWSTIPQETAPRIESLEFQSLPPKPDSSTRTEQPIRSVMPPQRREELVEIQPATSKPRNETSSWTPQIVTPGASFRSPAEREDAVLPRVSPETLQPITSQRSTPAVLVLSSGALSGIQFLGADSILNLNCGELRGPLIYAVQGTGYAKFDPSLVELGLPVSTNKIRPGTEPSSPTSYRLLNPAQRAYYLDWLASGRARGDCPKPYLELFLMGLERRVLVDGRDHEPITAELIRLTKTPQAQAFLGDLLSFLWLTIHLSCDTTAVTTGLIDAAIEVTEDWTPVLLRYCLATFAQSQRPLSSRAIRLIMTQNPLAVSSVVHQRHSDKFWQLFEQRVRDEFPNGIQLELGGRTEKLEYLFLNPAVGRLSRSETQLVARKRVAEDCQEIQALIRIWAESTNDLKAYDRAHRASETGVMSTAMWESLPAITRHVKHPEADAWQDLIQQGQQQFGRPLVRIEQLARIKNFEPCGRLTKKQSEQLLTTAGHLQLAIEPDSRLLGRNYAWDETVAVFPLRDHSPEDLGSYQAASVLLRLGITIAAADGTVDAAEVQRVTDYLSQQFHFSETAAERLEHLKYSLIHSTALLGTLEKSLREKLSADQRELVGEFLIGVAATDGSISPAELKALKKAWQALGLDGKTLDTLLKSTVGTPPDVKTPTPAVETGIVLDQSRIAQILRDTQRVAEMLRHVMGDEESAEETNPARGPAPSADPKPSDDQLPTPADRSVIAVSASPDSIPHPVESPASDVPILANIPPAGRDTWPALAPRYQPFLRELLTQASWSRSQVDQLARSQGLMPGNAIESVNQAFYDKFEDWLIVEEDDQVLIQQSLLSS